MFWGCRSHRIAWACLCLALLALIFPYPVSAAPVNPAPDGAVSLQFDILAVKADQTVTIRTVDFPIRTRFKVRMEPVNQPSQAVQVAEFFSDKGGAIEATYAIPEALRGQLILGLHIDSQDGYASYRWFINDDAPRELAGDSAKPQMVFSDVKKGASVTVAARNLPANANFWVRYGPFDTFYKNYAIGDMVTTGADGSAKFNLSLPKAMQNAGYITVRMDYGLLNVWSVYQNIDGGQAVQDTKKLVKFEWCRVVNVASVPDLAPGEEFDAVWTVQNVSNSKWKSGAFGYKYKGGEKLQKYNDIYSINDDVPDGRTLDVAVDMIAPQTVGWHNLTWVMFRDNDNSEVDSDMCLLKLSVFVKGN